VQPTSSSPSGSGHPGQADKPKVIYIMGSGRCGSTILGVALGNCEGSFFVGELDRWLPSDGTPVLGGVERTRFWNGVRARVEAEEELLSGHTRDTFERALGLVSLRNRRWRRRMRPSYRRTTEQLYRVICEQAGATHIVESSHFPLRAEELKKIDGIDVYLIFLVRHPQSVMASFTKTVNRNDRASMRRRILTTNLDLWATHVLAIWTFLRHRADRRLFMRYEEFTADPEGVLKQVLAMADSAAALPDLGELHTGFPMGGNRLLRSEVVALKAETPKPVRPEPITAALQMPFEALFAKLRPVAEASPARTPTAAS
jgi:hypothetical protein